MTHHRAIAPARPGNAAIGALALTVALVLAACSSSADPTPTVPGASPGASLSGSPGASPGSSSASQGSVTTPEQAAALVLASDPRFAGVGPVDLDLIGQSAYYTVEPAADGWTVVVTLGWGDCPSGCIEKHMWTYKVTTTGAVALLSETGPEVPPEAIPPG